MKFLIKKIIFSNTFKKILLIFIVGFISRILVNYIYDVNVFKEYTTSISLVYYSCMACFVGIVNELPKISVNVLDFSIIRKAFQFLVSNRITSMCAGEGSSSGATEGPKLIGYDKGNKVPVYDRFSSAGARALYETPNKYNKPVPNDSISVKLKRRLVWHLYAQFTHKFDSYSQFKSEWNPNSSIKDNLRRNTD